MGSQVEKIQSSNNDDNDDNNDDDNGDSVDVATQTHKVHFVSVAGISLPLNFLNTKSFVFLEFYNEFFFSFAIKVEIPNSVILNSSHGISSFQGFHNLAKFRSRLPGQLLMFLLFGTTILSQIQIYSWIIIIFNLIFKVNYTKHGTPTTANTARHLHSLLAVAVVVLEEAADAGQQRRALRNVVVVFYFEL